MRNQWTFLGTLILAGWIPAGIGATDFMRDVKPVLEAKCLSCHNPNNAKGQVLLSDASRAMDPAKGWIVPGRAERSRVYQVVVPTEHGGIPEMPEKGEPLTKVEAEHLRQWIQEGAPWPEGVVLREASKADSSWWAYQPLLQPALASVDEYIDKSLLKEGMKRNGPADRRTLIRRVTYDLTGLPPTPAEVDQFVHDPDPQAYEKLVERLLASPRYGERWGRHWLDVIRFGESNGYERNFLIQNLWPFRDYVIASINEDKPFDQFIREHLAGDVVGRGEPHLEVGSAFLVAGPYDDVGNQDPAQAAQIRANTLDEIISTVSEAFLGMTMGCARCHDHKFDPISQRDYYSLYATFSGIRHGEAIWASAEEKEKHAARIRPLNVRKAGLEKEIQALEGMILKRARSKLADYQQQWPRPGVDRTGTEERFAPVQARFVRLVCEAQDIQPEVKVFRIDEFEVWSTGPVALNVALAENGGKAHGNARKIEDFPGAYGAHHVNDGKTGERFISTDDRLTLELAEATWINRVVFSSARGELEPDHPKFVFVADYRIEVSTDGDNWKEVAHGRNRQPRNQALPGTRNRPGQSSPFTHLEHRLLHLETTDSERKERTRLQQALAQAQRELARIPNLPKLWMGRRDPKDAEGPFHVFLGGNPQSRGEEVSAASPSTLADVTPGYAIDEPSSEAERRLRLAEWITHQENPLTPRVLVNRIWHYHFGMGIVDTPNDFGYMGGRPTHPELLDFLAVKLLENGWSLKAMHRIILLSQTYRQSSKYRSDAAQKDGDSRLLWRFPPRRLSAEEIRDTLLSVAGKLETSMGGPGFRLYKFMQDNVCTYEPLDEHGPETYRRAVYHQNARASVVDLMTDFDQPDCAFSTPRRARTTTPLQALTLLNHNFTLDMAQALADQVSFLEPASQASRLLRIAYQRAPSEEELKRLMQAIETAGLRAACRALLNSSELIYLD